VILKSDQASGKCHRYSTFKIRACSNIDIKPGILHMCSLYFIKLLIGVIKYSILFYNLVHECQVTGTLRSYVLTATHIWASMLNSTGEYFLCFKGMYCIHP
jgi:hypothetical protein